METPEPIELFKSRDFGDMLSLTFTFIRSNFKLLGKSILFISGPVLLLASVMYGYAFAGLGDIPVDNPVRMMGRFVGPVMLAALVLLLAFSLMNTVISEHVALYAEKGADGFTFEDIWQETRRDIVRLAFTHFCCTVLIGLASILFFIPGLYLMGVYSIVTTVQVYERCSMSEAMSRCFELVRGRWWLSFGVLAMTAFIASIMRNIFSLPLMLGIFADDFASTRIHHIGMLTVIGTVIATFGGMLCSAIPTVATALNYFNLREKHDGVGLMRRIQSIGGGAIDASGNPGSANETGW